MLTIRMPAFLFIRSLKVLTRSDDNIDSSPVRLLSPLYSMLFPLFKVHSSQYPDALKPLNLLPPLAKYQYIPILGSTYRSKQVYRGASALVSRGIQAWALGYYLQRRKQSNRPWLFLGIKLHYLYPLFILIRQCFSKGNQSIVKLFSSQAVYTRLGYLIHGYKLR